MTNVSVCVGICAGVVLKALYDSILRIMKEISATLKSFGLGSSHWFLQT